MGDGLVTKHWKGPTVGNSLVTWHCNELCYYIISNEKGFKVSGDQSNF